MKKFEIVLVLLLFYASVFAYEGKASYYHDKFHGRRTASGTIFNQNELTCAHKTLPFGTKLLVTNQSNGKKVEVIVTDRGPFIKGRHVDLSKSAAKQISMIGAGVQNIHFTVVGKGMVTRSRRAIKTHIPKETKKDIKNRKVIKSKPKTKAKPFVNYVERRKPEDSTAKDWLDNHYKSVRWGFTPISEIIKQ